jgi:phosphatidylglycerophosphate synthase
VSKPQDGLISRFLNRPISRHITRFLLKFPIHPNTWTISIFVLPLIASVFLVRGDYVSVVIGASIFQVFSILDGCDGEIARAKYLESDTGQRLDTLCDILGSILFAIGLGLGLYHRFVSHAWLYLAEGILCALFIASNEWLLRGSEAEGSLASSVVTQALYPRHQKMVQYSGLSLLGEKSVWWLFQLTKRDVAIFVFLLLAIADRPQWILHLWIGVTAASLALALAARLLRSR